MRISSLGSQEARFFITPQAALLEFGTKKVDINNNIKNRGLIFNYQKTRVCLGDNNELEMKKGTVISRGRKIKFMWSFES